MIELRRPWLVAGWPGMGHVALAALTYLAAKLEASSFEELEAPEFFDLGAVGVEGGVVRRPRYPRNQFLAWRNPSGARDLLLFVGEAQPSWRSYGFCGKVLDVAARVGVQRIFTFAAAPTAMHPSGRPRVFAVVNESSLLQWIGRHDVPVMAEGQISGLNGLLLGAAAERRIEAVCLLGELPFYAVAVPNPKASAAVLRVFSTLAGIPLDLRELEEQGRLVEAGLVEMLERAQKSAEQPSESSIPEAQPPEETPPEPPEKKPPDVSTIKKIEDLFAAAQRDRSKALELKRELDRLGLFRAYEDRFLDLFKREEQA